MRIHTYPVFKQNICTIFLIMPLSIGAEEILVINLGEFKTQEEFIALKTLLKRPSGVKRFENYHKIAVEWSHNGQVDRRLIRTKVTIEPDNVLQFQKLTEISLTKTNRKSLPMSEYGNAVLALDLEHRHREKVRMEQISYCENKIANLEMEAKEIEEKVKEENEKLKVVKGMILKEKTFLVMLKEVHQSIDEKLALADRIETETPQPILPPWLSIKTNPDSSGSDEGDRANP